MLLSTLYNLLVTFNPLHSTLAGTTASGEARTGPGSGVMTWAVGVGTVGVGAPAKGFVVVVGTAAVGTAAAVVGAAVGATAKQSKHSLGVEFQVACA